ncbi:hypothetical protein WH96_02520 [Kiloniella spongiae]|uniref:Magnetosome membrane associated protein MmeA n=1 Tax=Kiloniella spongiae TaxID=1489064 RepID=A0A0H2MNU6_9PROT|nr:hypothetical protein [Kiloniella spongiae]KLN62397.1 hypothetical protein WH96_02520 [Kiloniella spongiae]
MGSIKSSVLRNTVTALAAVMLLNGCSFTEEALWPSITGEEAAEEATTNAAEAPVVPDTVVTDNISGLPLLGSTIFESPGVTPGQPTGTHVGKKVEELRGDLSRLQARLIHHNNNLQTQRNNARGSAGTYHSIIAAMNTRLQVGTTPGNPQMVNGWNKAQQELEAVGASITNLNSLSNEAGSTSALAAFVLDSAKSTYELRGALDEDHRQLAVLEDEANQTVVILDRLMNELTEDIARTQNYFSAERTNLTALQVAVDNGEFIGGNLGSRTFGLPVPPPPGGPAGLVGRQPPLAIIRFDQPNVNYEQALFTAVSRALDRRPSSAFDLVTVAPARGNSAQIALATSKSRKYGEDVMRSLTKLGLPASHVSLSSTSNPGAQVPEVHVYLR